MQDMKDFVMWFLSAFPSFLLTPPISAFTGLAILAWVWGLLRKIFNLTK